MINYILKKSKRFSNKSSQDYLKHFEFALLNFDKCIKEEQKDLKKSKFANSTFN